MVSLWRAGVIEGRDGIELRRQPGPGHGRVLAQGPQGDDIVLLELREGVPTNANAPVEDELDHHAVAGPVARAAQGGSANAR